RLGLRLCRARRISLAFPTVQVGGAGAASHGAGANRHRWREPLLSPADRPAGARARGGLARGRRARVRSAARTLRLRQVDAALSHRRFFSPRDPPNFPPGQTPHPPPPPPPPPPPTLS